MKTRLFYIAVPFLFFASLPAGAQLKDAIKLKVTGNSYSDESVIRFLKGSSAGFDGSYDAWKLFSPNTNVPSLFTKEKNGKALSINAAGTLSLDTVLPVFMIIPKAGSYTINTFEIGKFDDLVSITITNLNDGKIYTINKDTSFTLVYAAADRDTSSAKLSIRFKTQVLPGPGELVQLVPVNVKCFGQNNGKINYTNSSSFLLDYKLVNGATVINGKLNPGTGSITGLTAGSWKLIASYQGLFDTLPISLSEPPPVIAGFVVADDSVYLFSENGKITTANLSQNAITYQWNFGDGTAQSTQAAPTHTYTSPGKFIVTLTASNTNGCSSSVQNEVFILNEVTTSLVEPGKPFYRFDNGFIRLYPESLQGEPALVKITDLSGRIVHSIVPESLGSEFRFEIPAHVLPGGVYIMTVFCESNRSFSAKFLIQN